MDDAVDFGQSIVDASETSAVWYRLFVALACMTVVVCAGVFGCDLIGRRKRRVDQDENCREQDESSDVDLSSVIRRISPWTIRLLRVALLLLLGAGVSLVIWGSFVRADGNQHQNGYQKAANGLACVLFGFACILFSYPFVLYSLRGDTRVNIIVAATFFFVIPGWVLLAISLKHRSSSFQYEFMTMRITNSRAQFDNTIKCEYGGATCMGYRGQIETSWASALSCPGAPADAVCSSWITDPNCDAYTHDGNNILILDDVSARYSVKECIKKRYNLWNFGREIEYGKENDGGGNSSSIMVEAYGSCPASSCKAVLETSDDMVAVATIVGITMSVVGVCILLLAGTMSCGPSRECTRKSDMLQTESEVETDTSLEEVEPSKVASHGSPRTAGVDKSKTSLCAPRQDNEGTDSDLGSECRVAELARSFVPQTGKNESGTNNCEEALIFAQNHNRDKADLELGGASSIKENFTQNVAPRTIHVDDGLDNCEDDERCQSPTAGELQGGSLDLKDVGPESVSPGNCEVGAMCQSPTADELHNGSLDLAAAMPEPAPSFLPTDEADSGLVADPIGEELKRNVVSRTIQQSDGTDNSEIELEYLDGAPDSQSHDLKAEEALELRLASNSEGHSELGILGVASTPAFEAAPEKDPHVLEPPAGAVQVPDVQHWKLHENTCSEPCHSFLSSALRTIQTYCQSVE